MFFIYISLLCSAGFLFVFFPATPKIFFSVLCAPRDKAKVFLSLSLPPPPLLHRPSSSFHQPLTSKSGLPPDKAWKPWASLMRGQTRRAHLDDMVHLRMFFYLHKISSLSMRKNILSSFKSEHLYLCSLVPFCSFIH